MFISTLVLFSCFIVSSQEKFKIETYNYGYNGMEYIIKEKKGTTIVSTFHSKMDIKNEIAKKVFEYYSKSECTSTDSIIIKGDKANVTGKMFIKKKGLLTSVTFFYEKIEWKSGLTEIFTGKNS